MNKKYIVGLRAEERSMLEAIVGKGKGPAYRVKHANILLAIDASDADWSDGQTAKAYRCHENTVRNVRQRFLENGLEASLEHKKQMCPSREQLLDGEQEARLTRIACSTPPEGYSKWTLKMLADELVALEVVDSISDQTVRRTLKKTNFDPTCANAG